MVKKKIGLIIYGKLAKLNVGLVVRARGFPKKINFESCNDCKNKQSRNLFRRITRNYIRESKRG